MIGSKTASGKKLKDTLHDWQNAWRRRVQEVLEQTLRLRAYVKSVEKFYQHKEHKISKTIDI